MDTPAQQQAGSLPSRSQAASPAPSSAAPKRTTSFAPTPVVEASSSSSRGLDTSSSQKLTDALYSHVTVLDLSDNPLGVHGAKTMARLLNPKVGCCAALLHASRD